MFRFFIFAVLGFLAGAVLTYSAVVFGIAASWDLLNVHDHDGGAQMALGLVIGPFCAVIGGLVSAILVTLWAVRRRRTKPPATDEEMKRDMRRFFVLGGTVVGGIIGHYAAQFGFWLASPIQFDAYWKVWVHAWLPMIAVIASSLAGGFVVRGTLLRSSD